MDVDLSLLKNMHLTIEGKMAEGRSAVKSLGLLCVSRGTVLDAWLNDKRYYLKKKVAVLQDKD